MNKEELEFLIVKHRLDHTKHNRFPYIYFNGSHRCDIAEVGKTNLILSHPILTRDISKVGSSTYVDWLWEIKYEDLERYHSTKTNKEVSIEDSEKFIMEMSNYNTNTFMYILMNFGPD